MQATMTFKGNVFSMINFREINGHVDSLPYEGTLCINGKPFVDCYNDGCGGLTDFSIIDKELYQEALDSIVGETEYVKEYNYTLYIDLYYVADSLAYNEYIKNFSHKI